MIRLVFLSVSRWENGYNNPSLEQFLGLCKLYAVKDSYKMFGEYDLSDLIYELNRDGMAKLNEYKNLLIASGMYAPVPVERKIVQFRHRTAPMYDIGAAAGAGQFPDSDSLDPRILMPSRPMQ